MRTAPVDVAGLARFILSQDCQSIVILSGAGVSTASGIPDFRSPGGMYDTLRPELITATDVQRSHMKNDPTEVVSWSMFSNNAFPYLEVRRPFILGSRENKWKATIFHRFAELLHTKTKKLQRIFTQNIDGLEFQCQDLPRNKIVAVHGTIREAGCEGCGTDMDYDQFCNKVETHIKDIYQIDTSAPIESKPILCENCQQPLVKPKTVLFQRSLPTDFFDCWDSDLPKVDLLLVAGTSLVVSPANMIVDAVPKSTIRVVVNKEEIGRDLGMFQDNDRDVLLQGDCDDIFLELI